MIINHNISALNTYRQLTGNQFAQSKSLEKLSSGLRINRAGDDAAGLAISEKMRAQIRGLDQATRNAQDGISLIQTAEGALNEVHSILQRMRELSNQAANATNTDNDRQTLQDEITQLKEEIDRIGNNTEFNTMKLLNGEMSGSQVGGTGSQIGEATAAVLTLANFDPDSFAADGTKDFQVIVDGVAFNLVGVEGNDVFEWFSGGADSLKAKLEDEIKQYNDDHGTNIQIPEFTINVTDQNDMDFVITSGSTGSSSSLEIIALDDGGAEALDGASIQQGFIDASPVNGSDGLLNEEIEFDGSSLTLSVNGHNIEVALTDVKFPEESDMGTLATALQTDIQAALDNYKDLTGKDFGEVTVSVKDGSLVVESSNPDTVNIQFAVDELSSALGLAGTATSTSGGLNFHIGANKGQSMNLQINDMRAAALNIADLDISTRDGADNALDLLDDAISQVAAERSKLGAVQNRLEHTINNLSTGSENLTAAESRIRDVDMAKEMMEFTKNNILSQAAQAMLAQANQQPQAVLQLLR